MNPFETLAESGAADAPTRIHGVVIGLVTNTKDPDKLARVKVKFPWLSDSDESDWARVATPMAGNGRGLQLLPEVDDEVLVAFEHGDMRFPYVLGVLWNGKDKPPEDNADGKNDVRVLKSRGGLQIRLTDEAGKEKIEIVDKSGKNRIVIDAAAKSVTIAADGDVTVSAPQGTLKLEARTIELKATGSAKLESGGALDVKASGALTLKGASVDIN